jgi:S-formylglutathione hydrolase FrmB
MDLSRRQLLLLCTGAATSTLLGAGALLGPEGLVDRVVPPHGDVPGGPAGVVVRGELASAARRTTVGWAVAYPPGSHTHDPLPVALVLHGRSGNAAQAFSAHRLDRYLAAAVRTGTPPFALASVDGGQHSYWHRRADGDDPQAMLLDELLPMLSRRGLRTESFGVTGWSMGGYGALLLAGDRPHRVTAVAVDAAALWRKASETAPGAFDGEEDFRRHDVMGHLDRLRGIPLRVGCGRSDPFIGTNRALVRALPATEHAFPRGAHTIGCWNQLRLADMRFLGRHLTPA